MSAGSTYLALAKLTAGAWAWPLFSLLLATVIPSGAARATEAGSSASATGVRHAVRCDLSRVSCHDERGRWVVRRRGPLLQVRSRQGRIHSFIDRPHPGYDDHLSHALSAHVAQANAVHVQTEMHEGYRGDLINLDTGAMLEASGAVVSPDGRQMAALYCDDMGCHVSVRSIDWRGAGRLTRDDAANSAPGWSCALPQFWLSALEWHGNARVELRGNGAAQQFVLRQRRGGWASNLPCQPSP